MTVTEGQVVVTREIAAPSDRLWAMVSDVTRMGEWSPENESATWMGGATGPEPGSKFRGVNRNGNKTWKTVSTVLDAEPGQRFSFRVSLGPLKVADWIYTFDPSEAGCRVTETFVDSRGGLVKSIGKLGTGVTDREEHNRRTMETTLERLAAAAEGAA